MAVAIDVGSPSDEIGAEVEGLDQDGVATGIVEQSLLREDADLEIDGPGVIPLQPLQRPETRQPDARVYLDMGPHAVRAVGDAHFERPARPPVDILFGEVALGFGDPPHGFGETPGPAGASLVEAGFVEVDGGVDEAGQDQPAAEIDLGRVADEIAPDRGKARAGNSDIERPPSIAEIGAADHSVERHGEAGSAIQLAAACGSRASTSARPSPVQDP